MWTSKCTFIHLQSLGHLERYLDISDIFWYYHEIHTQAGHEFVAELSFFYPSNLGAQFEIIALNWWYLALGHVQLVGSFQLWGSWFGASTAPSRPDRVPCNRCGKSIAGTLWSQFQHYQSMHPDRMHELDVPDDWLEGGRPHGRPQLRSRHLLVFWVCHIIYNINIIYKYILYNTYI